MTIFSLHGPSTESTSRHTFHPVEDIRHRTAFPRSLTALVVPTERDQRVEQRRRQSKDATLKAKQGTSIIPSRDGGLTCQLHFDLLASVKLLTELLTLAASVAIAATWVAEGLDGSALTAVWSVSTDVLMALV